MFKIAKMEIDWERGTSVSFVGGTYKGYKGIHLRNCGLLSADVIVFDFDGIAKKCATVRRRSIKKVVATTRSTSSGVTKSQRVERIGVVSEEMTGLGIELQRLSVEVKQLSTIISEE